MKIKKIYREVAENYQLADRFSVISQSHRVAFQQILDHMAPEARKDLTIVDIGGGDGRFLSKLSKRYATKSTYILDISEAMLDLIDDDRIKKMVGDAAHIDQIFPPKSVDVVIIHHLFAYIDSELLLNKCRSILKDEGYISIITSLGNSFSSWYAEMQRLAKKNLIAKISLAHAQRTLSKSGIPTDYHSLKQLVDECGYEILKEEPLIMPCHFATRKEVFRYFSSAGWFNNYYQTSRIPKFILKILAKRFLQLMPPPYEDNHLNAVMFLKKINPLKSSTTA